MASTLILMLSCKKMAKFVFIDVTVTVSYGGIQTAVWHLAKELHDLGHQVSVFGGRGHVRPDLGGRDISVHLFPFVSREKIPDLGSRFQRIGERLSMAVTARRAFLEGNYDWAVLTKPFDFFWPWIVPKKCHTRFVFSSGGTDFFPGDRFLARRVQQFFACSHFNAWQLAHHYKRFSNIIFYGVDLQKFYPVAGNHPLRRHLKLPEEGVFCGFAGRLVGWKGLRVAIQAMHILGDHSPVRLVILGDGPQKAELQEHARSLVEAGRVFFRDAMVHQEIPNFYAAMDIGLFPSVGDEAFGIAIAEAMACGKPVIASAVGGIPEVVGNEGVCGLLVGIGDAKRLAQAMRALEKDPAFRIRMGEAARRRITTHFTWGKVAQRFLDGLEIDRAS